MNHPALRLRSGAATAVLVGAVMVLAGCGSSSSQHQHLRRAADRAQPARARAPLRARARGSTNTSSCGKKPGVKATGTPIPIGTIDTKQPGTDFSDGPNMITAYYNCVNANGGVNGHPVKLYVIYDQTQPAQIAAAAKQLIQTDHVVGIVGVFDLLECTIDQSYWKQLGIYEMGAGIAPECWSTPNSAAVNMGPRYSSDGAVQYGLSQHPSKIVFIQSNVPGTGYIAAGPAALAAAAHVPITETTANVPITDASSLALSLVDKAGPNGWVVLNFTPPEALVILQAAQKLGLEDRVKGWGCSTPCNTDFLATSLGPKWNHKLFVNAELTSPDDHNGPEMQLYKAILKQYGSSVAGGLGSFSEMGYLLGKFSVDALDTVTGPVHDPERQRGVQSDQGREDRAAVPAVGVRQLPAPHPEQRRLHHDPGQREDGDRAGMLRRVLGGSADRGIPQGRGDGTVDEPAHGVGRRDAPGNGPATMRSGQPRRDALVAWSRRGRVRVNQTAFERGVAGATVPRPGEQRGARHPLEHLGMVEHDLEIGSRQQRVLAAEALGASPLAALDGVDQAEVVAVSHDQDVARFGQHGLGHDERARARERQRDDPLERALEHRASGHPEDPGVETRVEIDEPLERLVVGAVHLFGRRVADLMELAHGAPAWRRARRRTEPRCPRARRATRSRR